MRTFGASIVVSIGLASGQQQSGFVSLITDEDGSTLGFALDGLKTKQPNTWNLKVAGTTLRWLEAPARIARFSRNGTRVLTSRNWTTLGRRPNCTGGSSCLTAVFHSTHSVADSSTEPSLWSGSNLTVWMNDSGQDVVWRDQGGGPLYLTELQQGGRTRVLSEEKFNFLHRLADGSLFVYDAQRSGYLTLDGKFEPISNLSLLNPSVVSGDGSRLFYWQGTSLRVRVIRTGEDREIFQSARPAWAVPSSNVAVSRNGNVVLLTQPNGLTGKEDLIALTGGQRLVLIENESVLQSALSSDGKVAFCVTDVGRILRITIDSFALQSAFLSAVTELVPRTPKIGFVFPGSAGSQTTFTGTGLSDITAEAPPNSKWRDELGGVALQADNLRFPIGFVSPTAIRAQIPFELGPLQDDDKYLPIEMPPNNSPFVAETVLRIPPTGPVLLHQNQFSDTPLLSVDRPLVYRDTEPRQLLEKQGFAGFGPVGPNERLHILVTGLGPTNPPVETGAPGPVEPPALAVRPVLCKLETRGDPASVDVPVEFAGLEAGLVGIYRITVKLPEKPWGYLRFPGFGLNLIP